MAGRIVDCGRLELKGAVARFKQKGTLEASDRNLGDLRKLLVRVSPLPELRLFADFVFEGEIFRVFQESTLINYKDFLEKVDFSGPENFRAFVRHASHALPARDTASTEFVEKKAPPERFVSRAELAAYEEALLGGREAPVRAVAAAPDSDSDSAPGVVTDADRKAIADAALVNLAVELEQARAQRSPTSPLGGALLAIVGAVMILGSLLSIRPAQALPENAPHMLPFVALGAAVGLVLLIAGLFYVRAAQKPAG